MPTTDDAVNTVASLLVNIHRDERGVFTSSITTVPLAPRTSTADVLAHAPEVIVDSETIVTRPRASTRVAWRRYLIAAAVLLVVGAIVQYSPSGSSGSPSTGGSAISSPSSNAVSASSAGCTEAGEAACSGVRSILRDLGAACSELLSVAAHAIGEDPQQWSEVVVPSAVRSGTPLAEVIRKWLTGTRADVLATRYADVHLGAIVQDIDSAIAEVDTSACSRHA